MLAHSHRVKDALMRHLLFAMLLCAIDIGGK
jgi:hypothetical protein